MAAGDWLLGCVPLQQTDTGLFNRACYLSGSYGLWKPVLTVGLGAVGGFLYYFVVKALNADIDAKYRKTKIRSVPVRNFHRCSGADYPYLGGNHGVVHHLSGPAHRRGSGYRGGHRLSGRHAPRHCADVRSDDTGFRHPFRDAACGQDTVFPVDAGFSPGHMESFRWQAVPDIAQAMQVPVATWMSVMSQSSTNTAIVIWCIAAAVYARNNFKRKESLT